MPKRGTTSVLPGKLKEHGYQVDEHSDKPFWDGPASATPMGGITNSLLSRYVSCTERFRIKVIEGLAPPESFSHRMEYGSMWHVCEESFARGEDWGSQLVNYCQRLAKKYRGSGTDIMHWMEVCKAQFPHYEKFWKKHPDITKRTPLLQEQVFGVPYKLPSGRIAYLRGKWDSVDLVTHRKKGMIWLQENKSKSQTLEQYIARQLNFDLQTMLYIVALGQSIVDKNSYWSQIGKSLAEFKCPIAGVRYNVIRRPLGGGRHSIQQWKPTQGAKCPKCKGEGTTKDELVCPKCEGKGRIGAKPGETYSEFYARLSGLIASEPEYFFYRWNVELSPVDIERFKVEFLDPCLENLCDDYEWWDWCKFHGVSNFNYNQRGAHFPYHRLRNWRLPFGVYNPVAEGGSSDYDEMLATGSTAGLVKVKDLFPELR